eukprot:2158956-Amphidinium_carterae.1
MTSAGGEMPTEPHTRTVRRQQVIYVMYAFRCADDSVKISASILQKSAKAALREGRVSLVVTVYWPEVYVTVSLALMALGLQKVFIDDVRSLVCRAIPAASVHEAPSKTYGTAQDLRRDLRHP